MRTRTARSGSLPPDLLGSADVRRQLYRMRAPSSGREVILEAEPGAVYTDRETGEELEVVGKVLPLAPSPSSLPWAVETLRFCNWCDQPAQKDLNDCPHVRAADGRAPALRRSAPAPPRAPRPRWPASPSPWRRAAAARPRPRPGGPGRPGRARPCAGIGGGARSGATPTRRRPRPRRRSTATTAARAATAPRRRPRARGTTSRHRRIGTTGTPTRGDRHDRRRRRPRPAAAPPGAEGGSEYRGLLRRRTPAPADDRHGRVLTRREALPRGSIYRHLPGLGRRSRTAVTGRTSRGPRPTRSARRPRASAAGDARGRLRLAPPGDRRRTPAPAGPRPARPQRA